MSPLRPRLCVLGPAVNPAGRTGPNSRAAVPRAPDASGDAAALGRLLFDAALSGAVPLHDFLGGEMLLRRTHPKLGLNDLVVGRGIAIGLLEDAARRPEGRLLEALREVADLVERSLTHGRTAEAFRSALCQIGEVVDGALAAAAPPSAPPAGAASPRR